MSLPLPFAANRVTPVAKLTRGLLEYRATPPSGNSFKCSPTVSRCGCSRDYVARSLHGRASDIDIRVMSQMNPASSRAMAMTAILTLLPRAASLR